MQYTSPLFDPCNLAEHEILILEKFKKQCVQLDDQQNLNYKTHSHENTSPDANIMTWNFQKSVCRWHKVHCYQCDRYNYARNPRSFT